MSLSFSSFSMLYVYIHTLEESFLSTEFHKDLVSPRMQDIVFRQASSIPTYIYIHTFTIYIYIHLHTVALTFEIFSQIDLDERTQTGNPINGYTWPSHSNRDPHSSHGVTASYGIVYPLPIHDFTSAKVAFLFQTHRHMICCKNIYTNNCPAKASNNLRQHTP